MQPAKRRSHDELALHGWAGRNATAERRWGAPAPTHSSGIAAIRSVGIIGAGMMGTAIAAANLRRGLPVVLSDVSDAALAQAPGQIAKELAGLSLRQFGKQFLAAAQLVRIAPDVAAVANCDLVIESVPESLPLKRRIYRQLEEILPDTAILATNASTIPIGELAAELSAPGRFCGMHFFHPVGRRPLVEIVRGPRTSANTLALAADYARRISKRPLVVADGPGFLVNRLLLPYLGEGMDLLLEGTPMAAVEQAATAFGMAMGPLRLLDEIGLDTALACGMVLEKAYSDRLVAGPLLVSMIKAKRLGRKSGAGFYQYICDPDDSAQARRQSLFGDGLAVQPDPQLSTILAHWARAPVPHDRRGILQRLLLPMVLEASRLLEEAVVGDPRAIDVGAVLGLGFPAARGGLLGWADSVGLPRIVAGLRDLEQQHGPRFCPTALLTDMARHCRRFYARRGLKPAVPAA